MWDLHNMSDSVISNIIQQLSIQQQNKLIIWLHSESKKKINTDVDKGWYKNWIHRQTSILI
jgi:hypothetical protein